MYPSLISDFHYDLTLQPENTRETAMTDRQVILSNSEALVSEDLELSFRAVRADQSPGGVVPR